MRSQHLFLALCLALPLVAGCTTFPALDRTITPALEAAPYPELVPLGPVLARAQAEGVAPERANAALDRRIAALRARAAGLRGSVLSGRERQRLAQGLQ
ncbi:hypothetical protein ABMC89_06465 [Sulfitobacter sp. HNIBRBA3233]|uniref:hypothetical protein n=1 Tax=Sulfitobacter marinivivus TaxID=3158558 RepID=UPI0032DE9328